MALNFPNSPTVGQIYTDSTSGFSYEWDGTVWKSFTGASSSNIKIIDDISSSFNGSTQTFPLTANGSAISPPTSQSVIVNLGGVIQDPSDDYTISGSNITFTTAPASGLTFSAVSLGPAVPIDYANDGNVYTRTTFTATAGQTNFTVTGTYTVGYLEVYRNGVRLTSGSDFTATDGTTFVLADAANLNDEIESIAYNVATIVTTAGQFDNINVTGISTLTGQTNASNINATGVVTSTAAIVGSAVTVRSTGINAGVGIVTATEYDITNSSNTFNATGVSVTGVVTSTAAIVGSAVTVRSTGINVTGVVTATSFVGSGSNLSGLPAGYSDLDNMLFG